MATGLFRRFTRGLGDGANPRCKHGVDTYLHDCMQCEAEAQAIPTLTDVVDATKEGVHVRVAVIEVRLLESTEDRSAEILKMVEACPHEGRARIIAMSIVPPSDSVDPLSTEG